MHYFLAECFGQVAYMAARMMGRDLVSFAMQPLNFYNKVDFIL
jgi:hypothetical protein